MWLKRTTCLDKRVTRACYRLKLKRHSKGGKREGHYVQNNEDKLNSPVTMIYYFSTHALLATEDAFCRAGQVCCVV